MDRSHKLKMAAFRSSNDLIALFQHELDRILDVNGQRQICDFGAYYIRPRNVEPLRLTHAVFANTLIGVPNGGHSLRHHSDHSGGDCYFLADATENKLWLRLRANHETEDKLITQHALLLQPDQYTLNRDIDEYFSPSDQQYLARMGLKAPIQTDELVEYILTSHRDRTVRYLKNDVFCELIELPISINRMGQIGTKSSYHHSREFICSVLTENNYTDDDEFFQLGSAHIHPKPELTGLTEAIANRIGEYKVQMTLSPADVRVVAGSIDAYNKIAKQGGVPVRETSESFVSIVGVNELGVVTGIQHHDFGLVDNMRELFDLNNRTRQTWGSTNPDIGLIAAHYEFLSDPAICSTEIPCGEIGDHVGLP